MGATLSHRPGGRSWRRATARLWGNGSRTGIVIVLLLVLTIGTGVTLGAALTVEREHRRQADVRLDRLVERAEAALNTRFRAYEDALRAGAALFMASNAVTPGEWTRFAEAIDVTGRYPGVNGMGVIFPVAADERRTFLAKVRAELDPAFEIRRLAAGPDAADMFVSTYIEPYAGNEAARGFDMGSESNRRVAIERARDTGRTTMARPITLVQDSDGFLVYVPFYRAGAPLDSVEARRAAIQGFVYAPFVAANFLEEAIGGFAADVGIRVFDAATLGDSHAVFESGDPFARAEADRAIHVMFGGEGFDLEFHKSAAFDSGEFHVQVILAAGAATTFALAALGLVVRLARRARLRARRAEDAAQHQGDLVNLASHELRNPLAILSLSAEMLQAEAALLGAVDLADAAAAAYAAAGRAEAVVTELLDLSRLDADRLRLDVASTPLAPAIDNAISLTTAQWGDRPLAVSPAASGSVVLADPDRLAIILRNMVDNAFKYSPPGTAVSIDVDGVGDDRVSVTVSDHGPGVIDADRAAVFDRFARSEATAHAGGLGIGLYLSRELARRMGGELELLPRHPHGGARFRLVLRGRGVGASPEPAYA